MLKPSNWLEMKPGGPTLQQTLQALDALSEDRDPWTVRHLRLAGGMVMLGEPMEALSLLQANRTIAAVCGQDVSTYAVAMRAIGELLVHRAKSLHELGEVERALQPNQAEVPSLARATTARLGSAS